MGSRLELFKEVMPLATKLVWPVFAGVLLVAFGPEAREFYDVVMDRVRGGAGVELGGFKLSEQARTTQVGQLSLANLPIEAIGGVAGTVEKASLSKLESLRARVAAQPRRRIDTLRIVDGSRYSPTVLKDYVTSLGVRFVIFEKRGTFDGWIDAGLLLSQVPLLTPGMPESELRAVAVGYDELRSRIVGIDGEHVVHTDSAQQVLERMQKLHTDHLPVLNQGRFAFFASRGEILSSLISNFLTADQKVASNR